MNNGVALQVRVLAFAPSRVLEVLRAAGKPLHVIEIARTGFPGVRPVKARNGRSAYRKVLNALRPLRKQGLVRETAKGTYEAIACVDSAATSAAS